MASDNGTEIRVLAATGVCGSGFHEASLDEAMCRQPHFIGCDCGSTDPGPYPLGAGVTALFCVNHVVEPDDPSEMFPIEYMDVH